jgi:hypothetical protein
MDRVASYREILGRIMERYAGYMKNVATTTPGLETIVVTDAQHDQFALLRIGWHDTRRVRNVVFHARIKNGKIWIEDDNTDATLADELLKAGVPRDDIVLAFHPPERRHLTEFATA